MSTDRRESLRTEVELPLQWLSCEARAPTDQLCKLFGLPGFIRFHGRLAALASEFSRALHEVRDPATIGALEILDAKLNVFDEALHAETATPPEQSLELATQGIGFDSAEPISEGVWLAVHLVLPTSYHVLCNAQVPHCDALGSGYRIGAALHDLDTTTAKRLTRFVISSR
ncbi:MAG: hypothetical protein VB948_03045 [Pseudomonadales bacterium]